MAERIPLVQDDAGRIKRLAPGDTLAFPGSGALTLTADGDVIAGQSLRPTTAGHGMPALADSQVRANVIVLAAADIAGGATGPVQSGGVLELTTGQWDAVASTSGGLTPGYPYYLSADVPGMLAETPPAGTGQYIREAGVALSTTELLIGIRSSVRLRA